MCNKNCCNHTHHALIFLFILCLLLLLNAPNLNFFHQKSSTDSTRSSSSTTTAGEGDGGSLSPCMTTATKMAMAFLFGALFTLFLMIVANNSGVSSPKHNNNEEYHYSTRGAHPGAGPSREMYEDEMVEGGGVGIGYTLLRTFPTFAYSVRRPPKMGKGSTLCVICQCKFRDGELVRCLPECDHIFHLSCIDKWLTSHKTCPSCRDDLEIIANHGSNSNGITASNDYNDYFNQYSFYLGY